MSSNGSRERPPAELKKVVKSFWFCECDGKVSIRPQTEAANDPRLSWIKSSNCTDSVSVASGLG